MKEVKTPQLGLFIEKEKGVPTCIFQVTKIERKYFYFDIIKNFNYPTFVEKKRQMELIDWSDKKLKNYELSQSEMMEYL